jgi:hypothetical protein
MTDILLAEHATNYEAAPLCCGLVQDVWTSTRNVSDHKGRNPILAVADAPGQSKWTTRKLYRRSKSCPASLECN